MKRALDVVLASMALIAASPLIVVIALAIRIVDGSPVLFRSTRVGRDRAEFVLLKFRTMPTGSPVLESSSAGELAITRTGRVLRRLSFDELPQLINVVKGDMSIVGPRPPLPSQAELIRLRVENGSIMLRPGMTGLAQVHAFNGMSTAEKADWDGRYTQQVSLRADASILARTVWYLLRPPPQY